MDIISPDLLRKVSGSCRYQWISKFAEYPDSLNMSSCKLKISMFTLGGKLTEGYYVILSDSAVFSSCIGVLPASVSEYHMYVVPEENNRGSQIPSPGAVSCHVSAGN